MEVEVHSATKEHQAALCDAQGTGAVTACGDWDSHHCCHRKGHHTVLDAEAQQEDLSPQLRPPSQREIASSSSWVDVCPATLGRASHTGDHRQLICGNREPHTQFCGASASRTVLGPFGSTRELFGPVHEE